MLLNSAQSRYSVVYHFRFANIGNGPDAIDISIQSACSIGGITAGTVNGNGGIPGKKICSVNVGGAVDYNCALLTLTGHHNTAGTVYVHGEGVQAAKFQVPGNGAVDLQGEISDGRKLHIQGEASVDPHTTQGNANFNSKSIGTIAVFFISLKKNCALFVVNSDCDGISNILLGVKGELIRQTFINFNDSVVGAGKLNVGNDQGVIVPGKGIFLSNDFTSAGEFSRAEVEPGSRLKC